MLSQSEWLTVQEAAARLDITDGRVRQLLIDGSLKGQKFGNTWAIALREVKRFEKIERRRGNPNFLKKQ